MATQSINSIDYTDLYAEYDWFSRNYPPAIQQACDEFFLPGFQFILAGISKNVNSLMDKDAYFVTKVRIDKQHDMFFRFSEKAVGMLLDKALGKPETKFSLNRLTDLEAKIISSFNDFLYGSIEGFLSPAPPTLKRSNFDVIHLTFLLKDLEQNKVAKCIITLPEILLNPDIVESQEDKFNYNNFALSTIDISLKIGTTKFKLIDVKSIDIDDIVVFDNSDTSHMVMQFKDYEKDVILNPNLGLVIPFENEEGEEDMSNDNINLWDSIEVEMEAQFDSVKITLGELKRIEKGLVVDLTSIYDNKVTLSVENKPIAKGELVIVNDRYGVKIEEVITHGSNNTEEISSENEDISDEVQNDYSEEFVNENTEGDIGEADTESSDEEEEFDYSDFELEDEDI